jgi:hypothetical protein
MPIQVLRWLTLAALAGSFVACTMEQADDDLTSYRNRKRESSPSDPSTNDGNTVEQGGSASTGAGTGAGNGGAATPPATGGAAQPAGFAQTCVDEINRYRATKGLPALARWSDGEACADSQSLKDSQTRRAHGAFGQCREAAQNECPGWDGQPETMIKGCLKMMWNEGPGGGHYESMASRRYTSVACGMAVGRNGEIWSVQNFR